MEEETDDDEDARLRVRRRDDGGGSGDGGDDLLSRAFARSPTYDTRCPRKAAVSQVLTRSRKAGEHGGRRRERERRERRRIEKKDE